MKTVALALLLLASGAVIAEDDWPVAVGAAATVGTEVTAVYRDPKNRRSFLIKNSHGCYLVNFDEKEVLLPNCPFRLRGTSMVLDPGWRNDKGKLGGVAWGDPKTQLSLWSRIFRRPRFSETGVEFFDNCVWIKVTGLSGNST